MCHSFQRLLCRHTLIAVHVLTSRSKPACTFCCRSGDVSGGLQQEVERLRHERDALARQCEQDALTFEQKLRENREFGKIVFLMFTTIVPAHTMFTATAYSVQYVHVCMQCM